MLSARSLFRNAQRDQHGHTVCENIALRILQLTFSVAGRAAQHDVGAVDAPVARHVDGCEELRMHCAAHELLDVGPQIAGR